MEFYCRSCASPHTSSIIPLGTLPLANALLSEPTTVPEPMHNLEVMICSDCGLAQLRDLVDPVELFSNYVYFSSNADTALLSAANLVDRISHHLQAKALVVEIASNDGYLLKNYVAKGVDVLGIDPAQNIAKVANDNGIPTLCDFFGEELALKLATQGKQADVIHANNVMAHVPDINGFIKGLRTLLKPTGQAIIEVPYWLDLVQKIEFDTIYHEHVYYFSVKTLRTAFERHGLELIDVEKLSIHGGSLRLFVMHHGKQNVSNVVNNMIHAEDQLGLHSSSTFLRFMDKLNRLKDDLTKTLASLKEEGARIAAYGASAKGTTLLNFFGIGKDMIDFVVDRSQVKQGRFTPGKQLKILAPDALLEKNITHALLLSWNFVDEIMDQQQEFTSRGGQFIIPLPEVKILLNQTSEA